MVNRPKVIGTAAESAVVMFLRGAGFPHVERRALRGTEDAGDIAGTPGLCWEVKGGDQAKRASDGQVEEWLREVDRETLCARADVGVLVMQRAGYGPARCGQWWAILRLRYMVPSIPPGPMGDMPVRVTLQTACLYLRMIGYGEPL